MENRVYKNFIRFGLAILFIFPPIARGAVRMWSITPVFFLITVLIFSWLWRVNNQLPLASYHSPITRKRATPLDRPILLFFILALISLVFSIYRHASFYALLRLLAYIGIYYLVVNNYSRRMRRYLIAITICVGTVLSIYGLLQYMNLLPHGWWRPRNFLAATYVNHNHFSGYLELVIPVAIGALIRYKRESVTLRMALAEALIIMTAAFIFAQSRGAWISLSVSLLVMNFILIKKKMFSRKSIYALILAIIFIFSFAYIKSEFISRRIDTFTRITKAEASPRTRLEIWKGTLEMIKDKPVIGTGIGTFAWEFSRYRPRDLNVRANYAHNDYLHMAAEMGVAAPLILIWLLWSLITQGAECHEKTSDGRINTVVLGCAIGILSLSLHGLIDFNFHIPANMILFSIYAAIIIGSTASLHEEAGETGKLQ